MYYINQDAKDLFRIFDQNSREGYLRLDLNENPVGLDDDFIKEVLATIDKTFISQYPETNPFQEYLADYLGADFNQVCLTNGSAEAIRHIFEVYSRHGGKIVSVTPSYAMYEVYAKMYGRVHVGVPYRDNFKANVDDIINAIDDDTDIVVLLNPNNPIGDAHTNEEVQRVIDAAKKHYATVLIDEAYHYFYPNSMIKFALENEHVFVTRTFSKLFSLAGLRLGYAVGQKEGIELVQKMCTPHNVGAFGIRFAEMIMKKEGMVDSMIENQLGGKSYLVETLKANNYNINALEGNFIFIEAKSDPAVLVDRMKKEKKILIKHYAAFDKGQYIRISTGPREAMEQFLDALFELDK